MIERIKNWRDELGREKSIFRVLLVSSREVGNRKDVALTVVLFVTLHVLFFVLAFKNILTPGLEVVRWLQSSAGLLLGSVASILGFLIAGFSIFATMSTPALFEKLAQIKHNNGNLSEFKFIFFNFMYIFIHYILYLSILVAFTLLFAEGPALRMIVYFADRAPMLLRKFMVYELGIIFLTYTVFSLFLLKSFVWNLYQAILVIIFEPRS